MMEAHERDANEVKSAASFAAPQSDRCRTKHPVVLVHGLGFRDRKLLNYWGRIPKALEDEGAWVFYSHQDAWGTIEHNAAMVKRAVLAALEKTGAEKVNLLAHSKGGLDSRYMISALDMEDKVASLTTISTPHHGSKTMDFLLRWPHWMYRFAGVFVDLFFKILGDKKPTFYRTSCQMETAACAKFNEEMQDADGVYYQSYAAALRTAHRDIIFMLVHRIVKQFDGDNDGVVSVESSPWGEFHGEFIGTELQGLSHGDLVDMHRRDVKGIDIRAAYKEIVSGLKDKGF